MQGCGARFGSWGGLGEKTDLAGWGKALPGVGCVREITGMTVRLRTGPAGSGKTRRCLEEIRVRLEAAAEGAPLVLLAPRQMTFQLERQLLVQLGVSGYTRLQVVSFERLCFWLWEVLGGGALPLLSAEGRVMVFRALMGRLGGEVGRVLGAGLRGVGVARELSDAWVEFQRHRVDQARLQEMAGRLENRRLAAKLSDLARLSRAYEDWLLQHGLGDVQSLPERLVRLLETGSGGPAGPWIEGVWVDGFAELAPHEVAVLAALTRHCREMTVTFCWEEVRGVRPRWLSPWWIVARSKERLEEALRQRPGVEVIHERLEPRSSGGRFDAAPDLRRLERCWAGATPGETAEQGLRVRTGQPARAPVRLVCCEDPLAEASFVAREIWRFVRAGGRFRDVLVLVRDLEGAMPVLRRVFGDYEIPCHWDRREPVGHHPLVVLTRGALRLVARNWRLSDWFAVLKSGLVTGLGEEELDAFENQALACGWSGRPTWWGDRVRQWWAEGSVGRAERWDRLMTVWREWDEGLGQGQRAVSGRELADALRRLWRGLGVEERLAEWAATGGRSYGSTDQMAGAVHGTVWEEAQGWLEDLELAFGEDLLEWREWLPVLEAGLGSLTVGIIPPGLDQVLVGTVDRSRQSEARLVFLPGWNEGVFPARPVGGPLLSEEEWRQLAQAGLELQRQAHEQRAREEHWGYVACTRAREQLVISWCRRDGRGRMLNPSPFCARLRAWMPVTEEVARDPGGPSADSGETAVLHWRECWPWVIRAVEAGRSELLSDLPEPMRAPAESLGRYVAGLKTSRLSPGVAERLYGRRLRLSATQLERFMACPFQFFVWGGLLARERRIYEVDMADRGSFLHQVLALFHERVTAQGRKWRDLSGPEVNALVQECAQRVVRTYREGLFAAAATRRWMARRLEEELTGFLEVVCSWMHKGRYKLDPVAAELVFGGAGGAGAQATDGVVLQEWDGGRILELTGRLDRVDACKISEKEAVAAVMDYKSGRVRLERLLLEAGVDLQLRVYLVVLEELGTLREKLGVERIRPVGAFYVPLRPGVEPGLPGEPAGEEPEGRQARQAYQHQGVFDAEALEWLEAAGAESQGEQFVWRRNQDGSLRRDSWQAKDPAAFRQFVEQSRQWIRAIAARIWSGDVGPDPYRHGSRVACDRCECGWICRLDRQRHRFRRLTPRSAEV